MILKTHFVDNIFKQAWAHFFASEVEWIRLISDDSF